MSRDQHGRRRHAIRNRHEPNNRPRLGKSAREGIDTSSDRTAGPMFREVEDGGLGRVAAAVGEAKIRTAGQQAVRLGAQELRPGGPDPPRRRAKTRAAKNVGDGRGDTRTPSPSSSPWMRM